MAFTYCENCGEKIDDSSKFCPNCGYTRVGVNGSGTRTPESAQGVHGNYGNGQSQYGGQSGYGTNDSYGGQGGYGNQNPYSGQGGYGNGQNGYGNTPPPYGNGNNYGAPNGYGGSPYGGQGQNGGARKSVNTGITVFSVIVMMLFSPLFGILALITAMKAPNEPTEELMEKKNKTALILCIVGVIVSIVITVV